MVRWREEAQARLCRLVLVELRMVRRCVAGWRSLARDLRIAARLLGLVHEGKAQRGGRRAGRIGRVRLWRTCAPLLEHSGSSGSGSRSCPSAAPSAAGSAKFLAIGLPYQALTERLRSVSLAPAPWSRSSAAPSIRCSAMVVFAELLVVGPLDTAGSSDGWRALLVLGRAAEGSA